MNRQLKQIARFIQSQQLNEARSALDSYLEARPKDAWAWYLLSFVMPDKAEKTAAAQRALTLDPANDKIRARLKQLQGVKSRRLGMWAVVSLAVILVLIVGVVFIALSGGGNQANLPIPTLAVLAAPTDTPIAVADENAGQAGTEIAAPLPTGSALLATATDGDSNSPTPDEAQNSSASLTPTSNPTQVVMPPTSIANLVPANPTPTLEAVVSSPTAAAPTEDANQATATPSPTPSATHTLPPTGVIEPGAPLNTGVDIGFGEMRVVDAARPGETRIRELGGTIPAAPANQAWVLVEVLVACREQATCSLSPSALQIVGSSGAAYTPSPQLNMTPIFGSLTSNRQIWGYLGFVVPNSENSLRLMLSQGSQTHLFALQ